MTFYSHKIRILIIYHFYGFLSLRTNPAERYIEDGDYHKKNGRRMLDGRQCRNILIT